MCLLLWEVCGHCKGLSNSASCTNDHTVLFGIQIGALLPPPPLCVQQHGTEKMRVSNSHTFLLSDRIREY
jgi:hypothetical protein